MTTTGEPPPRHTAKRGLVVDEGRNQQQCQQRGRRDQKHNAPTLLRFGARQQRQCDRRCGKRKYDAADPGRAFKAGGHGQGKDQSRQNTRPLDQTRQQKNSKNDAHGRGHVLRRPADLKNPAAETPRVAGDCVDAAIAGQPAERRAHRRRGGEHDHPRAGRGAARKPDSEADHHGERSKSGEPGEPGIRFPAGDAGEQRQFGGTEVPEIIIGEPRRRAGAAEERIMPAARRSAPSRRSSPLWSDRRPARRATHLPTNISAERRP